MFIKSHAKKILSLLVFGMCFVSAPVTLNEGVLETIYGQLDGPVEDIFSPYMLQGEPPHSVLFEHVKIILNGYSQRKPEQDHVCDKLGVILGRIISANQVPDRERALSSIKALREDTFEFMHVKRALNGELRSAFILRPNPEIHLDGPDVLVLSSALHILVQNDVIAPDICVLG